VVFFLSLVFLVCILACYQEREALMKNSDELDWREFFKFKAVRRSVVFYCAFAFFSFLTVVEFSSFALEKDMPFLSLPLAGATFLILQIEAFLSETSRETSMRLRVERRIKKNLDKLPLFFLRLLVVALLFKLISRNDEERILRMSGVFLFAGAFFRGDHSIVAYFSIVLRELFMPKTFLGGGQKITAIRKFLRCTGILLGATASGLPFILWK
jgi:hypothetical protein